MRVPPEHFREALSNDIIKYRSASFRVRWQFLHLRRSSSFTQRPRLRVRPQALQPLTSGPYVY